jgi:phosphoribosylformimino-5-aminoimidazole carboxamide ribotide isomerase
MLVIPAIDIKAGSVVRLIHGDPKQQTTYSSDPVEVAKQWVAQGLNGSMWWTWMALSAARRPTWTFVFRIKDAVNVVVQFGGDFAIRNRSESVGKGSGPRHCGHRHP